MRKQLLHTLLVLSTLVLAASCKKDNTPELPNLLTNFCNLTFVNGKLTTGTLDDGKVLDFSAQGNTASVNDTVIRYVITYSADENPRIYSNLPVMVCMAEPADSTLTMRTDPINVLSTWQAGRYVNMHLTQMTTGAEPHPYAASADSLSHRTLYVTLHHGQPAKDAPSYSQPIYASLHIVTDCYDRADYDAIALSINTFDGLKTYTYPLK